MNFIFKLTSRKTVKYLFKIKKNKAHWTGSSVARHRSHPSTRKVLKEEWLDRKIAIWVVNHTTFGWNFSKVEFVASKTTLTSITNHSWSSSKQTPFRKNMPMNDGKFGWWDKSRNTKYSSSISSKLSVMVSSILIATCLPVVLSMALYTSPYVPASRF